MLNLLKILSRLREESKRSRLSRKNQVKCTFVLIFTPFLAVKVRFRHQDDAIKVRSNKKLFKEMPNIYLKYGKDEKSVSIAPNIDDDLADLANLAGKSFGLVNLST